MPGMYARRTSGTGKVASGRYHTGRNEICHHSWHSVVPQIRDLWNNALTQEQRDLWQSTAWYHSGPRDYVADYANKGFAAFGNANWPYFWGIGGPLRYDHTGETLHILGWSIVSAIAATQVITVEVTYVGPPGAGNKGATYFFHIDPARTASIRAGRFTRHLCTIYEQSAIDNTFQANGPARWPFTAGQQVHVGCRHCYAIDYEQINVLHFTAT